MTSIENIRAGLEDLIRKSEQEPGHVLQQRSLSPEPQNPLERLERDSVNIAPSSLRRLQASLAQDPLLSAEEARLVLEELRNSPATALRQVHDDLDPARVFALLDMDE